MRPQEPQPSPSAGQLPRRIERGHEEITLPCSAHARTVSVTEGFRGQVRKWTGRCVEDKRVDKTEKFLNHFVVIFEY